MIENTSTGYSAYAPDIPGCVSTGHNTKQVVKRNMREAIEFHLAGERIPVPHSFLAYVPIGAIEIMNDQKQSSTEESMNTIAITKSTIIQELSRLPETSLYTVKTYLETLLKNVQPSTLKNQSLQGIWKDQGFEKIVDLQKELHQIRQGLQANILQRPL